MGEVDTSTFHGNLRGNLIFHAFSSESTGFFRVTFLGVLFVIFSGAVTRDLHLGDQVGSRMEEAGKESISCT